MFDRRSVAISVTLALTGALVAALIATVVLRDDDAADGASDATGELTLTADAIDPDALATVQIQTPDGLATRLDAAFEGKPMVVNLWQHNCVPCVEEMPLLQAASQERTELTFVGIASQDPVAKATEFAEATGITYAWFLDPDGEFTAEARTAGMPTTILLGADGAVLAGKTGAFSSRAELDGWIDDGLAGG